MITMNEQKLLERLEEAVKEQERIKYSVLHFVTGVINREDSLTTEQKSVLLDKIWRDE